MLRKTILFLIAVLALVPLGSAGAQSPVVRAVLFYSPTCPHCHKVMTEDLPPLVEKYGAQLEILAVDVTTLDGQTLYQSAIQVYQIPQPRLGVPNLTIGVGYLVGSVEIPSTLPMLIENGLAGGGIDWPAIPGLEGALADGTFPLFTVETPAEAGVSPFERFAQDPLGNTLAVLVLAGMLFSVAYLWTKTRRPRRAVQEFPAWTVPALAIAGLVVAAYLTYIELTAAEAVCGPVGDCNAVQQSPYAMLFGFIPIGLLGLIGYGAMLLFWALKRTGNFPPAQDPNRALWTLALAGTLFSIYLTFLEPFVIGATCAWCLASAVIMTALLWVTSLGLASGKRLRRAR